jgi:hypothetical protein
MKIGIITTAVPLFSNGLAQNAYFIYDVLSRSGHSCELLTYDSHFTSIDYNDIPVKCISPKAIVFDILQYKVVITVGSGITKEMYLRCKENGTKVIAFICGNVLPMNMVAFLSETSKNSVVTRSQPVDEVWMIDAFAYMKTYIELMRGAPVRCVPHLWSPCLLEFATESRFKKSVEQLQYSVKSGKKINLLILEPNIDFVKNALIPIMAAEKVHQLNPDIIAEVYVFNFPEKSNCAHAIIDSLSIRSRMRIFKSQHIAAILTHFNAFDTMPIFVSHQILTPWNYLYYELMYYGYPLVHNSSAFSANAYFYSEYDIDTCASQILHAAKTHNASYTEQLTINRRLLESINPANETTVRQWASFLH